MATTILDRQPRSRVRTEHRSRSHRLAGLGVALALVTVTAATLVAPPSALATQPAPTSAARSTTMVPPSSFGPYRVGRQVLQISSRTGRSRTVDVWYPADARATGTPAKYVAAGVPNLFFTNRALDRVPVATGGPFPLVVSSHGSGSLRFASTFFTETLASHGFVVIAPDHTGDTAVDLLQGRGPAPADQTIAGRAADVRMIVNGVLTRSAARGDRLYRAIDPNRIGITGHSWGGLTAFATLAGNTAPGVVPIPRDRRFKAIVTMDATPNLLTATDLAQVTVPTLSIVGEGFFEGNTFWSQTRSSPYLELRIDRAAHGAFSDICLWKRLARTQPRAPQAAVAFINSSADAACYRPHLGSEQVHLLTNRYAIAFLLTHLAGDRRYAGYLTPRTGTEFRLTAPSPIPLPPPGSTTPLPPVID